MRKALMATVAVLLLPITAACAATLALPGVVFTAPASTSITCTEATAANLVVPVAAGATIFSCTVAPASWMGSVSLSGGSPFTLTAPVGNAFNVITSVAVTAPATDQPGTLTTAP
jgi:hypothetical protein